MEVLKSTKPHFSQSIDRLMIRISELLPTTEENNYTTVTFMDNKDQSVDDSFSSQYFRELRNSNISINNSFKIDFNKSKLQDPLTKDSIMEESTMMHNRSKDLS